MSISLTDGLPYSRKHPMSCWLAVMTTAFAGGFLSCLLLGEAMLTPFRGFETVLLSTLVWYCMFYSPFDITYKVAKFLPVKVVLASMKEVYRAKKVYDGVSHAWKLFPNAWIILVITGVIKGNTQKNKLLVIKRHSGGEMSSINVRRKRSRVRADV